MIPAIKKNYTYKMIVIYKCTFQKKNKSYICIHIQDGW